MESFLRENATAIQIALAVAIGLALAWMGYKAWRRTTLSGLLEEQWSRFDGRIESVFGDHNHRFFKTEADIRATLGEPLYETESPNGRCLVYESKPTPTGNPTSAYVIINEDGTIHHYGANVDNYPRPRSASV